MAKVLDFKTRLAYNSEQLKDQPGVDELAAELTGLELYSRLFEISYEKLDALIKLFKQTGKWNPTAEKLMHRVCEDVRATCASIAGAENGQTERK